MRRTGVRRSAVLIGAAIATVVLVVVGCGSSKKSTSTGGNSSARIIDGTNEYDYDSFTVDLQIFQGLYGFPTSSKLAPVLAKGCNHSADLKTWTCELRQGVKFSNVDTMTSADVKYSFDRVLKIKGDQ